MSGKQTIDSFISELSKKAGKDMNHFIFPWLKSRQIPKLSRSRSVAGITVRQKDDIFIFPLEVGVSLKNGTSFITVLDIHRREENFKLSGSNITGYVLDPGNKVLFNTEEND